MSKTSELTQKCKQPPPPSDYFAHFFFFSSRAGRHSRAALDPLPPPRKKNGKKTLLYNVYINTPVPQDRGSNIYGPEKRFLQTTGFLKTPNCQNFFFNFFSHYTFFVIYIPRRPVMRFFHRAYYGDSLLFFPPTSLWMKVLLLGGRGLEHPRCKECSLKKYMPFDITM